MIVTNGTVSRTYKTADYEGRTVSLSFSLDPGEDYDACVAEICAVIERRARSVPENTQFRDSSEKPEKKPARRPPSAVVDPQTPTGNDISAEGDNSQSASPEIITDDAMMKACQKAGVRLHSSDAVRALVREYTGAAGKSVLTIGQSRRVGFLAELSGLKVEENNGQEDTGRTSDL